MFINQIIFAQEQPRMILFSHDNLSGISNAKYFNGQIHFVAGIEPKDQFPGYPDANSKFNSLVLQNETGHVLD
ncbi:MAG: hypothetical protein OMM_12920, partial [Candidatus Magnetoglobus multicellularis str. Araruama]